MKQLILASLITLLAIGTACGQASAPEPDPVASDGIQVHGHWTVTVSNPDGTVDAAHEFENSLTIPGASFLTALLAGEVTVDQTYFRLGHTSANPLYCLESHYTYPTMAVLVATVARSTEGTNPLMFAATCTVDSQSEPTVDITMVFTHINTDQPFYMGTTSAHPGQNLDSLGFTQHQLESPISVIHNQAVSVNVLISFS